MSQQIHFLTLSDDGTILEHCNPDVQKEVVIPNSVLEIGEGAFADSSVTSVIIPHSVKKIGKWAFGICPNLTQIVIPNSITTIGDEAFVDCDNLVSIFIPDSVTEIGKDAFLLVNNIVYHGTAKGAPWGAKCVNGYVDGYLVYNDATKTKLCGCFPTAAGNIIIPNSVTAIGDCAFSFCNLITSVTIPNSVITIGKFAFNGCSGLTSITIPDSVTNIGENAFNCCDCPIL